MDELSTVAENIIEEAPKTFNSHRDINDFYDGYSALSILNDINLIPPSSSLQELLIRNPFRTEVKEDLHAVLTRIYESGMRIACIFICEPIVFTIFW